MADLPDLLGGPIQGLGQLPFLGAEQLLQPVLCHLDPFDVGRGGATANPADGSRIVLVRSHPLVLEGVLPGGEQLGSGPTQLAV